MADDKNGESKFGFKDEAKAEETLQLLAEKDLQYQKLTVRGLLSRAKRVLTCEYGCCGEEYILFTLFTLFIIYLQ